MSQQPPDRPSGDRQPPPEQPTQPLPQSGQQPPQQGQPPQWGPPGQQPQPGWGPPRPPAAKKPWYRRPWPVIGLIALAFLVIGLLLPDPDQNPKPTTSPNTTTAHATEATEPATSEPTEPPTTAAPAAPALQRISGQGKTATKTFRVAGGMTVFRFQHRGQSNFIVGLLTSSGKEIDGLVNEIGTIEGATARGLEEGRYLFNVEADGPWSIRIEQPRPASGQGLPATAKGRGHSVAGPFQTAVAGVRFGLRHRGESNFIVDVLDADGQVLGNLSNEIGSFQGSTVGEAPEGPFWLNIQADGSWTITMRPL
jgi:hypothetical protein